MAVGDSVVEQAVGDRRVNRVQAGFGADAEQECLFELMADIEVAAVFAVQRAPFLVVNLRDACAAVRHSFPQPVGDKS